MGDDVIEPKGTILVSGLVGSVSGAGMGENTSTENYLKLVGEGLVRW